MHLFRRAQNKPQVRWSRAEAAFVAYQGADKIAIGPSESEALAMLRKLLQVDREETRTPQLRTDSI